MMMMMIIIIIIVINNYLLLPFNVWVSADDVVATTSISVHVLESCSLGKSANSTVIISC